MSDQSDPAAPTSIEDTPTSVERPLDAPSRRAVETLRKLASELSDLQQVITMFSHGVASGKLTWDRRLAQEIDSEIRICVRRTMSALDKLHG